MGPEVQLRGAGLGSWVRAGLAMVVFPTGARIWSWQLVRKEPRVLASFWERVLGGKVSPGAEERPLGEAFPV